jgi:hypothetical protein
MERNKPQVWGPEFLNASKFLISKKERKDLKEGKDICLWGYESESLTATEAKSLSKRERER